MSLFNKPALDVPVQLAQWQGRGLAVTDMPRALHYLVVVVYYRLSTYSMPFQQGNPDHHFIPNAANKEIRTFVTLGILRQRENTQCRGECYGK